MIDPRLLIPVWAFICLAFIPVSQSAGSNAFPPENSLRFETMVIPDKMISPPLESDKAFAVLLCLKITNRSKQAVIIDKCETPFVQLQRASGEKLHVSHAKDHGGISEYLGTFSLPPNHSTFITVDCHLEYYDGILMLDGEDNTGWKWGVPVTPGKYLISMEYQVDKDDAKALRKFYTVNCWIGDAITAGVSITILPEAKR